jgi:protein-S-isoprenylcysteine O-methyltransferase Ste14
MILILKVVLALLWGILLTAVGIFLCFSIILAPVGILLIFVGAWPLYRMFRTTPESMNEEVVQKASEDVLPWFEQEE